MSAYPMGFIYYIYIYTIRPNPPKKKTNKKRLTYNPVKCSHHINNQQQQQQRSLLHSNSNNSVTIFGWDGKRISISKHIEETNTIYSLCFSVFSVSSTSKIVGNWNPTTRHMHHNLLAARKATHNNTQHTEYYIQRPESASVVVGRIPEKMQSEFVIFPKRHHMLRRQMVARRASDELGAFKMRKPRRRRAQYSAAKWTSSAHTKVVGLGAALVDIWNMMMVWWWWWDRWSWTHHTHTHTTQG